MVADGRVSARDMAARGSTQRLVKGPKSWLNVKLNDVQRLRQWGGKLRSSYPLKKA